MWWAAHSDDVQVAGLEHFIHAGMGNRPNPLCDSGCNGGVDVNDSGDFKAFAEAGDGGQVDGLRYWACPHNSYAEVIAIHASNHIQRVMFVEQSCQAGVMATKHVQRSLFDGTSLTGWVAQPRVYGSAWPGGPDVASLNTGLPADLPDRARANPAVWTVEDGAIVGRQNTPGSGYGGYLVTEEVFGDFELTLEARPDWPADTGVMIRRRFDDWAGLQVLYDHRPNGSVGGFFGNGIGGFLAAPFTMDRDDIGDLVVSNRSPWSPRSAELLTYRGAPDSFLAAWDPTGWNELRVRCIGSLPRVSTWVNGIQVAEIDLAYLDTENYDAAAIANLLGPAGHIALEVHDNDPVLGTARWAVGAACRWRNIRIVEL